KSRIPTSTRRSSGSVTANSTSTAPRSSPSQRFRVATVILRSPLASSRAEPQREESADPDRHRVGEPWPPRVAQRESADRREAHGPPDRRDRADVSNRLDQIAM